ncbi:MAG: D-aminoacyl-tRNA deacylase [Nitrospinota bacterium]|nr:D-aminoacyl-tRNA deacylase [Nitrospinota bacterium]
MQRIKNCSVFVKGKLVNEVGKGALIFLGVSKRDTLEDVTHIVKKIINLRIFPTDQKEVSIKEIKGELMIVSQFTLHAKTDKGRRPSFEFSETKENAKIIYDEFVSEFLKNKIKIKTGCFGKQMEITLTNDGPFTLFFDTDYDSF